MVVRHGSKKKEKIEPTFKIIACMHVSFFQSTQTCQSIDCEMKVKKSMRLKLYVTVTWTALKESLAFKHP